MMNVPALLFVPSCTGSCAVTFDPVCQMFYVIETLPPHALDADIPAVQRGAAGVRDANSLINYE